MGRYSSGGSYNHSCGALRQWDTFMISWTVDYYYEGSRLRYPRRFTRITDGKGARRFCKHWDIPFPERKKTEN